APVLDVAGLMALPLFRERSEREVDLLLRATARGINAPLTSSCGRLFDAVAALAGGCTRTSYEGQAAAELEAALWRERSSANPKAGYPLEIFEAADGPPMLDPRPLWPALLEDVAAGRPAGAIAWRFHVGLVRAVLAMIERLAGAEPDLRLRPLVLSGGAFQNAFLLRALRAELARRGFRVLTHWRLPPNDGGVAVGQAVVAAATSKRSIRACA
ncbi:MAG: hypothetical protein R3349_11540, partial [Geminicoccaceae bacterium]|nr:hypothetical protein [Geminicoccaceae bacterium]